MFVFGWIKSLPWSIVVLVVLSCVVQAAEGATFALVPYVAPKYTGAVSGIVGAGGNFGAVLLGFLFKYVDSRRVAFRYLAIIIISSSFASILLKIKDRTNSQQPNEAATQNVDDRA